jgi:hypothetical protein
MIELLGHGAAFLDFDQDGWLDVLLVGPRPVLYRNRGDGRFAAFDGGLERLPQAMYHGVAAGDVDNDGYPDLFISAFQGGVLLHNERGRGFRDITREQGLVGLTDWSTGASFADLDRDGRLDLILGSYVRYDRRHRVMCQTRGIPHECGPQFYSPQTPRVFRNTGRRLEDVTRAWGFDRSGGRNLGVVAVDLDEDGQLEVAFANDMSPGDLFVRKGARYENQGVVSGTAYRRDGTAHAGMGIDVGDYDRDARQDVVVTAFNWHGASLYRNAWGLIYKDEAYAAGVGAATWQYVGFGSLFVDLDNDTWLDLFIVNGHVFEEAAGIFPGLSFEEPSVLLYNHEGRFYEASSKLEGAAAAPILGRGLARGDYDNDGRIDLLVVNEQGQVQLLHNESSSRDHWLSIRLKDRNGRDGYGATVRAEVDGRVLVASCHADGSFLSASDPRIHLGLGRATGVSSLTVQWVSGRRERFGPLEVDRRIELVEGTGRL